MADGLNSKTKRHKQMVLALRQGGRRVRGVYLIPCYYCTNLFQMQHLTLDHIVRRRDGGSFSNANLILACELCNRAREEDFAKSKQREAIIRRHKQYAR